MLGMLRLVNPPGTPRKRPFPSYATANPLTKRMPKVARLSRAEISALLGEPKAAKKVAKNPSASTAAKRGGRKMAKLRGAAKAKFLKRMAAGRRKAGLKSNPPKKVKKAAKRKAAPKKAVKKTVRRRKLSMAKKAGQYHIKVVRKSKSGKRRTVKRTPQVVTFVRTSKKAKRKAYGLALHTVSRKTKKGVKRIRKPGLFKAYRNPDFKAMLIQGGMLFAGITGMKVINNLLGKYVVSKLNLVKADTSAQMAKVFGLLPSVTGFVAAAFAGKMIKNQPKLVEGLQVGATIALLQQVFEAFVKPNLPANMQPMFAGVGEYLPMQGLGGGYGEYLQPRQQMLGAPVQEALALDEYVSGFGNSFDVEEALADSEASGLQSGYAGGSLARTVFSS